MDFAAPPSAALPSPARDRGTLSRISGSSRAPRRSTRPPRRKTSPRTCKSSWQVSCEAGNGNFKLLLLQFCKMLCGRVQDAIVQDFVGRKCSGW